MIIKIGNVSLLPWTYNLKTDAWLRWVEYESINNVCLFYNKLGSSWSPIFNGSMFFLRNKYDSYAEFGNYKYKQHQLAMDQMDRFLIRMGKLTIFM